MATFGDIITRVMVRLSAMGGLDVQQYMQPKVAEMIRYRYDQLFTMRYWRDTVTTEDMTVDPATGLVTMDISQKIKRFIDIKQIIPEGSDRTLPEKRTNRSSKRIGQLQYEPYGLNNKIFRIVPTGNISPTLFEVTFRTRVTTWTEATVIPLDDHLIILSVCEDYATGEGANMEMAKFFGGSAKQRLADLVSAEMQHEKSLLAGEGPGIHDWHQV